jgi:rhamnosyltransferase
MSIGCGVCGTSPPTPRVGVVVVTHRARSHLDRCLPPLLASPVRPRVLVVNSSSGDGTVERARELGAETWVVPRRSFNHGLTRESARQRLGVDIVVMMTPDAYPTSPRFLETLVEPVRIGAAAVSYARQVAAADADPIARFGRRFGYPPESQLRTLADWQRFGSYTHFCSNACAAWSCAALDLIGGFRPTLVSEETIAAAELLERGRAIAYVAEAVVCHTHPTRLAHSFRRQFDIGYAREAFRHLLLAREGDEARGRRYVAELLRSLAAEQPALLPYALLDTAARLAGYRIGRLGARLPHAVARRLSGQDFYWDSTGRAARPVPAAA